VALKDLANRLGSGNTWHEGGFPEMSGEQQQWQWQWQQQQQWQQQHQWQRAREAGRQHSAQGMFAALCKGVDLGGGGEPVAFAGFKGEADGYRLQVAVLLSSLAWYGTSACFYPYPSACSSCLVYL